MLRWALLLALLSTSALASRADRLSVSPRLDRRDRLGAPSAASPILLSLSLLPPDSECSGTPPDGVTFTRASAATCIDSSGVAHALTTDEARVHGTLGLLVEGSETNAVLHSRDVVAASWSGTGCTRVATGMDGTTLVGRCTGATSVTQTLTVATGSRTASAYVRRQSGTCTVTLSADSESAGKALAGGWERLTLTYTSDGSVAVGIGVSSGCVADIDYVQDEAGSIATSPIVTSGTAAVRAQDVATIPNPGLSETTGCASIEGDALPPGTGHEGMISAGAIDNARLIARQLSQYASYDGTTPMNLAAPMSDTHGRVRWSPGERVLENVTAGTDITSSAFTTWPTFHSSFRIGAYPTGGSTAFDGHLRNLVLGRTPEACQ